MAEILATNIETKTWVTLGLVILALFEFWTAMHVVGRRGPKKHAKLALRLHRIFGYIFLVYWLWPIFVGLDLMNKLSERTVGGDLAGGMADSATGWHMDSRVFYHALLGVAVLLLLLLKICFVRVYTAYRLQARLLGIIITLLAITTWLIAGWFYLGMMGRPMYDG